MADTLTPEDKYRVDVTDVADQVIQSALDRQSGKTQAYAEPTPEKRGMIAPLVTPKGSSEPELGVPRFVHGPFMAFQRMWDSLAGGAKPTDPEVIKDALEVATSVVGAPIAAKATTTAARTVRTAGVEQALAELEGPTIAPSGRPTLSLPEPKPSVEPEGISNDMMIVLRRADGKSAHRFDWGTLNAAAREAGDTEGWQRGLDRIKDIMSSGEQGDPVRFGAHRYYLNWQQPKKK